MDWNRFWLFSGLSLIIFGSIFAFGQQDTPPLINVICIEWLDAKGETGWMTAEEYDPVARVVSCGHLVQETDDFIILALDRADEEDSFDTGSYNQIGSVPRGMIVKTWRLK